MADVIAVSTDGADVAAPTDRVGDLPSHATEAPGSLATDDDEELQRALSASLAAYEEDQLRQVMQETGPKAWTQSLPAACKPALTIEAKESRPCKDPSDLPPSLYHASEHPPPKRPRTYSWETASSRDSGNAPDSRALLDSETKELWRLLFAEGADEDDIVRWLRSGFVFTDPSCEMTSSLPCPWGLRQELGGPCGVLAAAQAFLVRELLWGVTEDKIGKSASGGYPSKAAEDSAGASHQSLDTLLAERFHLADRNTLLACSLVQILYMATPSSRYTWAEVADRHSILKHDFTSAQALADWLVSTGALESSSCPVVSFVCSLILTRGLEEVLGDMDDRTASLVGAFGHCSQELVNLCLTGRAVTNIFDGDITFEDNDDVLRLQGIRERPPVGFLSALEPLNLCEVGKLLKRPLYPLWLIGTSTHYSLFFSDCCQINHSQLESPEIGDVEVESPCRACNRGEKTQSCDGLSATLLHFNGRDTGAEKPALTAVALHLPQTDSSEQARSRPILVGDHDERLFEEVLKSRWPQAQISYQLSGHPPPRIH